ncbi:MAG: site-2 protease family protein [candidate division Zixibacteria bacterium]|nr:site-2 protease family protein [candidate division Zixibacteria bacterium]
MSTDNDSTDQITLLLRDLFEINAAYYRGNELVFGLTHRSLNRSKAHKAISSRLKTAGYRFTLETTEAGTLLRIDPKPRLRIPPLNIILFVATLFSIYVVPVFLRNLNAAAYYIAMQLQNGGTVAIDEGSLLLKAFPLAVDGTGQDLSKGVGVEFALALMSILLVHEMGHFIAGRRRHIITSWPYFIPAPNIIGTFGAIIKSRSPFHNRRDLIEVGAAGPLAGWVVAVFWLIYGLAESSFQPLGTFGIKDLPFALEGESILMRVVTQALIGNAPEGQMYLLSEAAFAGWVGLLVTAINLLPIGQLDGGHILYGLTRRHQHWLGMLAMGSLFVLGFQSPMWWVFAVFGLVFRVKHPPTLDDQQPLSRAALLAGIASIVILVISFTPIPFR